jgi:hypothetical protein
MTGRTLAIGWVVVALVSLVLLGAEYVKWRSLTTELTGAASERFRLAAEIRLREEEIRAETRKHAGLVEEMQWSPSGTDPSAFLTRLADLAGEKRITVTAVGPLERQTTPQFTRSWHAIQARAPYREIRELAARVEQDRGVLEDLRIEPAPASAGQKVGPSGPDELQARFRLTALELSPQGKLIVERMRAAAAGTVKILPGSPLALAVPSQSQARRPGRDPFTFLSPPTPPAPRAGAAPAAAPIPNVELRGIVSFPDGFLAIVNNQIVKVGDTVSGQRVERITENAVTLKAPDTPARTVELPELTSAAPAAAPRR